MTSRSRWPSSWPARCVRRRGSSPKRSSRGLAPRPGLPAQRPHQTATSTSTWIDRLISGRCSATPHRHRPPHRTGRSSSSTPRSTRTRRRTSGTCGTRPLATRSSDCWSFSGTTSKLRTTSMTPACRSPMSLSDFSSSSRRRSTTSRPLPTHRGSTTTAGTCTRKSPSGTRPTAVDSSCGRRPCGTSNTVRTRRQTWRGSSPTGSSRSISRRWTGSTSSTTC